MRIASDVEEFQTLTLHKVAKRGMRGYAHAVPAPVQTLCERNIRLHVACKHQLHAAPMCFALRTAASDNHYDDAQRGTSAPVAVIDAELVYEGREFGGEVGPRLVQVERDADAPVLLDARGGPGLAPFRVICAVG